MATPRSKLIPYAGKERPGRVQVPADVDRFKRKRIMRMIDDGMDIQVIADRWGVSKTTIKKLAGIEEYS